MRSVHIRGLYKPLNETETERTLMPNPFPHEDQQLTEAIASALLHLETLKPDDDEYAATVNQLSKLYKLRNDALQHFHDAQQAELKFDLERDAHEYEIEQNDRPFYARISPDVALTVLGNLTVALVVIKYEQTGVIATKALSFMKKF